MPKALCLFVCFWLAHTLLHAQSYQVEGNVVSGDGNVPLPGASVFINNGSKGTLTEANGHFLLINIPYASFELVISYISYETIVVKIDPQNIHKKFQVKLSPKSNELKEVIIGGVEKDGWKKWGPTFIRSFIGTSSNAQKCIIENPAVLRFRQNKQTGVLTVNAGDKLIIRNRELGYTINYQLEEFSYDNRRGMITYLGYSYFTETETRNIRRAAAWRKNRKLAYEGSVTHFMRSFYENTVGEEGFEMRQLIRLYKKDSATLVYYNQIMAGNFSDVDTARFFIQIVKQSTLSTPVIYVMSKKPISADSIRLYDTLNNRRLMYFSNTIQVTYKNELESSEYINGEMPLRSRGPQTSIFYLINNRPVVVERNGLYYEPLDLFTEGYWAYEKMAESLPSDYKVGD